MLNAYSLLVVITCISLSNCVEWSIAGDLFVNEGAHAIYNVALAGKLLGNNTAYVKLNITEVETSTIDHALFSDCVNTAIRTYSGSGTIAYDSVSCILTFYATDKNGDKFGGLPITVSAQGDTIMEGPERYAIVLSQSGSSTGATVTLGNSQVVTTIIDATPPTKSPIRSPTTSTPTTKSPVASSNSPCDDGKGPPNPLGPECPPLPPCEGKGKGPPRPGKGKGPPLPPRYVVETGLQLDYQSVLTESQKSSQIKKVHQAAMKHSCQPSDRVNIPKFDLKTKQHHSLKSSYNIVIRYRTSTEDEAHLIANKNTSTLIQQVAESTGADVTLVSAPQILSLIENIGSKKNISLILGLTVLFATIVFGILFIVYRIVKPRMNAVKTALRKKEVEISLLYSTNDTVTL